MPINKERFAATASAYDLPVPSYDKELTLVGRGTPAGELLRRYWHPVATSARIKDLPVKIQLLGEDLVLFRKPNGDVGLVYPRCVHRGADLFFGKITEQGIRCCYHGWTFETDGRCMDMPPEPERGERMRKSIRQPWYPVVERYGFVFAYLGPIDKKPPLPQYDLLENLPDGWEIIADDTTIPSAGAGYMPCNWLQHHENGMDPAHVPVLHEHQFPPIMASAISTYKFVREPDRIFGNGITEFGDMTMDFKAELIFPTIRIIPDPLLAFPRPDLKADSVAWTVPKNDTDTVVFTALTRPIGASPGVNNLYGGKIWAELTPEEHQRIPGDFEAQANQGPISYHSEEHFGTSDKGIALYRRMLRDSIHLVRDSRDPPLAFGQDSIYIQTKAGFSITPTATEPDTAQPGQPGPQASASSDAQGTWALVVKSPMGEQSLLANLCQQGETLTGTITEAGEDAVIIAEGQAHGNTLSWKSEIRKPMALTVKFNLTRDADKLTGTAKPGMFPASSVTGTRVV